MSCDVGEVTERLPFCHFTVTGISSTSPGELPMLISNVSSKSRPRNQLVQK